MKVCAILALALFLPAVTLAADEPPHTLGACGGQMTGYDGQQYACDPDRRPACDAGTGERCRCIEQRDCGGERDEPY